MWIKSFDTKLKVDMPGQSRLKKTHYFNKYFPLLSGTL